MTGSRVRFDADNGRLQLDRRSFAALAAWAARAEAPGGGGMGEELAALRAAGVLVGSQGTDIHPLLEPALRAVTYPSRRFVLRYAVRTGADAHAAGWIDDRCAALLVDRVGFGLAPNASATGLGADIRSTPPATAAGVRTSAAPGPRHLGEPECELLTVHPSFIPAALARLIGLGPRIALDGTVSTSGGLLSSTDPPGMGERRRALPAMTAVIRWSSGPGSAGERVLRLERTEAGGWFAASDDGSAPADVATPTKVWLALVGLLAGPGGEAGPTSKLGSDLA